MSHDSLHSNDANWLEQVVERRGAAHAQSLQPLAATPLCFLTAEHDALLAARRLIEQTYEQQRSDAHIPELTKISAKQLKLPNGFRATVACNELLEWRDPSMLPSHPINRALWALSRFAPVRSGYDLITLGANAPARRNQPMLVGGFRPRIGADGSFVHLTLPRGLWLRFIADVTRPWGLEGCPYWNADPTLIAPPTLVPERDTSVENFFYTAFHDRRGFPFRIVSRGEDISLQVGPLEADALARDHASALLQGIVLFIEEQSWARRDVANATLTKRVHARGLDTEWYANHCRVQYHGVQVVLPAEAVEYTLASVSHAASHPTDLASVMVGNADLFVEPNLAALSTLAAHGIDPRFPVISVAKLLAEFLRTNIAYAELTDMPPPAHLPNAWRLDIAHRIFFLRVRLGDFVHCYSPTVAVRSDAVHTTPLELVFGPRGEPAYIGTPPSSLPLQAAQLWPHALEPILREPPPSLASLRDLLLRAPSDIPAQQSSA